MSDNLFKEALADAQKLRELAIKDAQNTILETLTPKIKQFVEEQLLETSVEGPPRITNDNVDIDDTFESEIEQPIADETCCDSDSVCVSFDAIPQFNELTPQLTAPQKQFEPTLSVVDESIKKTFKKLSNLSETKSFKLKINKMITDLQNMYEYVQEVVSDPARKTQINLRLESYNKDLKQLQEDAMKNKKRIFEADELDVDTTDVVQSDEQSSATKKVSLNLNVPEDIADKVVDSLSDIEISLDSDEVSDSSEGEDSLDVSDDDEELDIDLDVSDEEGKEETGEGEDEELQLSSKQMDDDTVVEIDEAMLRTELKRMQKKSIRENGVPTPSADGSGVDDAALAAFGGGTDAGDPFVDGEVETAETQSESIKREIRSQKISQLRIKKLQAEGRIAKAQKNLGRFNALKAAYLAEVKKYAASVKRTKMLKESVSGRSNSATLIEGTTRSKLSEAKINLDNAKLVYANKTLSSTLSNEKKLKIVEQLDTATSPAEAKLVYESAIKLLSDSSGAKQQTNNAGSASRPVRSGGVSTRLNEGAELSRWSRLAGLDK